MAAGPAAIDASIETDRGFQRLVAEQLTDGFVGAVLGVVKNQFRAQVPELVRRQRDPRPLGQVCRNEQRDHRLAFWLAVGGDKNSLRPSSDDLGGNAIAVVDQAS